MSRDVEFISAIWNCVKSVAPKEEWRSIADELVEIFDDFDMTDGFRTESDIDGYIKKAVVNYFGDDTDEVEENDYDN